MELQDLELRTLDFSLSPGWLVGPSYAGMPVTEETALQLAPLVCGIRCITEDLASMPCYVYDCDPETDHLEKDKDNPIYFRLLAEPNDEMTSFQFFKYMTQNAILYGNAVAEIQWRNDGEDFQLWPVHPQHVRPYRDQETGTLIYIDTRSPTGGPPGEGSKVLPADSVIHIQANLSYQGCVGASLLQLARQVLSFVRGFKQGHFRGLR
jgi:HK97 family phage portal protein